jgi:hypothetical protein
MAPQCLTFKVSLSETNLVVLNGINDGLCELCNSFKSLSKVNPLIDYTTYKRSLLLIRELINLSETKNHYFDARELKLLIKNLNQLQNGLTVNEGKYHIIISDLLTTYTNELFKILFNLIKSN